MVQFCPSSIFIVKLLSTPVALQDNAPGPSRVTKTYVRCKMIHIQNFRKFGLVLSEFHTSMLKITICPAAPLDQDPSFYGITITKVWSKGIYMQNFNEYVQYFMSTFNFVRKIKIAPEMPPRLCPPVPHGLTKPKLDST